VLKEGEGARIFMRREKRDACRKKPSVLVRVSSGVRAAAETQ